MTSQPFSSSPKCSLLELSQITSVCSPRAACPSESKPKSLQGPIGPVQVQPRPSSALGSPTSALLSAPTTLASACSSHSLTRPHLRALSAAVTCFSPRHPQGSFSPLQVLVPIARLKRPPSWRLIFISIFCSTFSFVRSAFHFMIYYYKTHFTYLFFIVCLSQLECKLHQSRNLIIMLFFEYFSIFIIIIDVPQVPTRMSSMWLKFIYKGIYCNIVTAKHLKLTVQ